jgi:hypothetical protein
MDEITFAWCFSHGRLHCFRPSAEYPDGAWCTADWVALDGATEEEATRDKVARFGEARFMDHLPLAVQIAVMNEREARG